MSDSPIRHYERRPAVVRAWDPRSPAVAARLAELIHERDPKIHVEHVGSTAVPGLPGKGVIDLLITAYQYEIPGIVEALLSLGFQRQTNRDPFPPTRPMLQGAIEWDGTEWRIHVHVIPHGADARHHIGFRDALREDAALRAAYVRSKDGILASGITDSLEYSYAKADFVRTELARRDLLMPDPVLPPATIGILGGGQLGRMLGLAARAMGYRIVILDPDPECPARGIADAQVVAPYDDARAALELADTCAVVTYELEHVDADVVRALADRVPVRPGLRVLEVAQDRLAERRFLEAAGAPIAPWRPARSTEDIRVATIELGMPVRVKASIGGYDGRSQVRVASASDVDDALASLGRVPGEAVLVERELAFACELSVVCVRALDGKAATFPVARNLHDAGILVESLAPAPVDPSVARAASELAIRLATTLDAVGVLTIELFLLRDGTLAVNELAPRVHNSGHYTMEACVTSQFAQHIRAICGLPLGSVEQLRPAGMVNLLGAGTPRPAQLLGIDRALEDPAVALHQYDKRRVFERRKMGHLTATAGAGESAEDALDRARAALACLAWAE